MMTQTQIDTLGFVLRALQMSGVEFHDDPKLHSVNAHGWIEFTTFPEGRFRIDLKQLDVENVRDPDMIRLLEPVEHPTPDDPLYTQVYAAMFEVCENVRLSRRLEDSDRMGEAETLWEVCINPALDRTFKLLEPKPVVPPKQFHSGWNVPTFEPSVTCAGTWLQCFEHLDAELKQRQADGPPYEEEARRAREELWSLAVDEKAGWTRNGDDVFWIMELPGASA